MKNKKDNNSNILNVNNDRSSELLALETGYLLESGEPLAEAMKKKLEKIKALKKDGKVLYKTRFEKDTDIAHIKEKYSDFKSGDRDETIFYIAEKPINLSTND